MKPRTPAPTDFVVDVEGVGKFTFGKRALADDIESQRRFAEMVGGVHPTPWLEVVCGALSDLGVLTVFAPPGWDIEAIDPLQEGAYEKLVRVHTALKQKELSFRRGPAGAGPAAGAGAVADNQVPVPATV